MIARDLRSRCKCLSHHNGLFQISGREQSYSTDQNTKWRGLDPSRFDAAQS